MFESFRSFYEIITCLELLANDSEVRNFACLHPITFISVSSKIPTNLFYDSSYPLFQFNTYSLIRLLENRYILHHFTYYSTCIPPHDSNQLITITVLITIMWHYPYTQLIAFS